MHGRCRCHFDQSLGPILQSYDLQIPIAWLWDLTDRPLQEGLLTDVESFNLQPLEATGW
jgi:hypothetical protein